MPDAVFSPLLRPLVLALIAFATIVTHAIAQETVGPWKLAELFEPPKAQWLTQDGAIRSLL